MRPYLYKTETLPAVIDLAGLHEIACRFGEECFHNKGEAPFMWIMVCGDKLCWMETPWEDDAEKNASVLIIRKMMDVLNITAYTFITEAWVSTTDGMSKDEIKAHVDFVSEHGVSALPISSRDDVLMITSFDKDGGYLMSRYLVTLRQHGLNFLGPRVDISEYSDRVTGRMWNLLKRKSI
jgi:hypothetical protein